MCTQVSWSWTAYGFDLPTAPYTRKDLVVPGPVPEVTPGTSVYAALTAKFVGGSVETVVNVTLTPTSLPIKANLRAPSGDVRADRTIVLNATSSVDPDDPLNGREPFAVQWQCTREDFPNPCFPGTAYGTQRGLTWSIDGSLLTPNLKHVFIATLSKSGKSSMAYTVITPKQEAIPTGRIVRICGSSVCPEKHSADVPLSLSLILDAGAAGASVAWTSSQVPGIKSNDGECWGQGWGLLVCSCLMLPVRHIFQCWANSPPGCACSILLSVERVAAL